MRQRCKGTVNTDSVKVIKVNQQLAQSYKKPWKNSKRKSHRCFLSAKTWWLSLLWEQGQLWTWGFNLPSGFFLCLGKQNAGMQEPSCISARCNAEREQWDVPTHKHTFHRDMEVGGEHTSATLDRYALFSHQYYQKFLKESASKNYVQMME